VPRGRFPGSKTLFLKKSSAILPGMALDTGFSLLAWAPQTMSEAITSTALFALVGLILSVVGFKLFDWITPVSFDKELEKGNIAVGILCGAIVIGICHVIAAALS
jgi:putative membrane protein